MKIRNYLLCSLAVNAVLAVAVVYLTNQSSERPKVSASPTGGGASTSWVAQTGPVPTESEREPDAVPFDWQRVESADYRQYIANLRAIGCPGETIRDIIVADVNKLFAARGKAELGANRFQYWKGGNPLGNLLNEEAIAKQQALTQEKRDLLVELLGAEAPKNVDSGLDRRVFETMLDFLPPDMQNRVKELEERYAGRLMGTLKKARDGDTTDMRAVQAEKEAELLSILGPEEKFQYDLRMSQTAMMMRLQMGDLDLSEQEFQDVFKLRKQLDDQFGIEGMSSSSKTDQAKREEAKKEMNAQLQTLLGERYAEYKYEMSGEWAAQMLHRVANENNVSRESALKAYEMTDIARAEAEKIKADAVLSDAARQAALQLIHDETVRSVGQVLGQEAAESYFKKIALIPGFKTASR